MIHTRNGAKMNELISVIIPIYNAKEYLNKCVDSVINQTYKNIEIILVDDGSNDGSEEICKTYSQNYKNISCIHIENNGVSNARNQGIKISNGKYIGFVDADDYIDDGMYEVLHNLINYDIKYDMSVCEIYDRKSNGVQKLNSQEAIYNLFNINSFGGYACNKLFRKEKIDLLNLEFRENISMCEDLLFTYIYCKNSNNIIYTSEKYYFYINNDHSLVNNSFNVKQMSVIDTFNIILKDESMYGENIRACIKSNYVVILLKIYVKLLIQKSNSNIENISYIKDIINKNFKVFIKTNNIPFKYKLYSIIIMYFPVIIRLLK